MITDVSLVVNGLGAVVLVIMAVLVRRGALSMKASAGAWLFVAAGLGASLGVLYLIQRAHPGDPAVYTTVRLALGAGLVATMVRIVLLHR